MTEPVDFAAARWSRGGGSDKHRPIDALREVIRQIEAGEIEPDHVIVVIGSISEDLANTDWLQAGSFDVYAQRGLLDLVKNNIGEGL